MFFLFKYSTVTMYLGYVIISVKILKPGNISVILNSISHLI